MLEKLKSIFRKREQESANEPPAPSARADDQIKSTRQAPPKFKNEQEMKVHYAKNLDEIEPGLRLYSSGRWVGVEVPCMFSERGNSGLIDILAQDRRGDLVIIECKASLGTAAAFGQVMGYMAWLRAWVHSEVRNRRIARAPKVRAIILMKRAGAMLRFLTMAYPEHEITLCETEPKPSVASARTARA